MLRRQKVHVIWSCLSRDILRRRLHSYWLHSSWYGIIYLRRARNHLMLLMMLSLRNHYWLNELNLRLSWLSIHIHLVRINRLHLERLTILIEVTWYLYSILGRLILRMLCCLINHFYCLMWHTWLIWLPHKLRRMVQNLLNCLRWLMVRSDNRGCWLNDFCLCLNRLLFIYCNVRALNFIWVMHLWIITTLWGFLLLLELLLVLLLLLLFIIIYRIRLLEHDLNWLIGLLWNPSLLRNNLLNYIWLLCTRMW